MIIWLITIIAVTGNILNIYRKRSCFLAWGVSNIVLIIHNYRINEYAQMTLFSIYLALAIWGWYGWGKKAPNG